MRLVVGLSDLCTPGMGVNLWGASPQYVNPVSDLFTGTSTSRRQEPAPDPIRGRNREGPSEGSRNAKR
jgi:hypothetical protein